MEAVIRSPTQCDARGGGEISFDIHMHNLWTVLFTATDIISRATQTMWEARGSVVVKALCYKPEGRGLETR
jgi:hypothetical protein